MTIGEAFRQGTELLKNAGNEAPAQDAGVLLCYVADCGKVHLYAHSAEELSNATADRYFSMLERRAAGEPLQYLTGRQEFMSLPFIVGPGVLVPRQDTELLVETVLSYCKEHVKKAEILDIGAGSGCISVSLAYYLPACRITSVDKMQNALDIARENALLNHVAERVEFLKSDLFDGLAGRQFDVIVSNPPYIRSEDIPELQREVRCFEPLEALDGGADGLDFYRSIVAAAPTYISEGGLLAFETGYDQAASVARLMQDVFQNIQIAKDLAGIDRVVAGILKNNII
jgi:release factor glutamine methyltransferase